MDIHERLNQLLAERGWTRYRLAKECGLSEETLTNIFRRGTTPSFNTLNTICDGFKITLSQFFAEHEMVELSPELKQVFDLWVFLTPQQKEAIITTMEVMRNGNHIS